jgi:hypothetical protein
MAETIELTPRTTNWIFVGNGIFNTGLGLRLLSAADSWTHWSSIAGLLLTVGGLLLLIYGLILLSRTNKLTPKVQLDDTGILIKGGIYRSQRKIDWRNVREITYNPFELVFHLNDHSTETVNLATTGAISLKIKKTIRQFATDRQIKIVTG